MNKMESYGFICEDTSSSTTENEDDSSFQTRYKNDYDQVNSFKQSESKRTRKSTCSSRNAIMARENRKRKKLYLENIEKEVNFLKESNRRLEIKNRKHIKEIHSLKKQVEYLRNVVANSSNIEKLLSGLNKALTPKVIVKSEPSSGMQINRKFGNSVPLLGRNDPMLYSASNTTATSSTTIQPNEISQADAVHQDINEELPQFRRNNGRLAVHLPKDILQEEPER